MTCSIHAVENIDRGGGGKGEGGKEISCRAWTILSPPPRRCQKSCWSGYLYAKSRNQENDVKNIK